MRFALSGLLLLHGLIHLMGFVKAFGLAPVDELRLPISRVAGLLWLGASATMVAAAALLLLQFHGWYWVAGLAVVLSQVLVCRFWADARFGTIANIVILLPLIVAWGQNREGSFRREYQRAIHRAEAQAPGEGRILTEADLASLPLPVQEYLRITGSVGKPRVSSFRFEAGGALRQTPDSSWLDIRVRQTSFVQPTLRAFLIESSLYGVPFDGLHLFEGPHASMRIRVAGLFQVVDARGPKMDQAETVTLLNDLCLMAPSALVDAAIEWSSLSPREVRALFSHGGQTIAAVLRFDDRGFLRDFSSDDRFFSPDGEEYTSYRWTTPIRSYADFGGRKVVSDAEAVWHLPAGPFPYARFEVTKFEAR